MKRLLAALTIALLAAPALAQAPPSAHGRGHVQAPHIGHLRLLSAARHGATLQALPRATEPDWDSRKMGWVGPVKDQKACGSCWCFSGTGLVEIAYNKAGLGGGSDRFILSEQYTLSCGRNGGCNGDDNTTVLEWAKNTGLPLTKDYGPYEARGLFSRCGYDSSMTLYRIPDWGFADQDGGQGVTPIADIKAAIKAYGAVGCAIAADNAMESWGNQGASFDRPFLGSGSRRINHDVILIGWHDDNSIRTGGYWILRNSWSEQWGVGGYMAIAYGANEVGTESVFAVPPVNPNPPAPPTPVPPPTPDPTPPSPTTPGWNGTFKVIYDDGQVVGVEAIPATKPTRYRKAG